MFELTVGRFGADDDLQTKLKTSGAKSTDELSPFQDKLRDIDSQRKDGKFVDKDGQIPPGQAALHDLLAECYELKDEIMDKMA